jgi:phosphoribosylamine--glycine ligase
MKVMIVGGGGREHALAWKCARSPRVSQVYVAPGNAGTARDARIVNVEISAEDIDRLLAFARDEDIDLTIVGPEGPLVAGICDRFAEAGLKCFGPSAKAAQLEGSKAFSKDFLERHNIPTARYRHFTELDPALEYIREQGAPIVIKADGLAAGKGVVIARSVDEAEDCARDMLAGQVFGDAGNRIVVEEFLEGEEASFIVMVDGTHIKPLATSQDHKARDDGDKGPNTGGMGAYSPAPVVTPEIERRIMREVIEPTVAGLADEGIRYVGFLYAGLMIGPDGTPRVLEFNCRFGDPETQPIMMRMRGDLPEMCLLALEGRLDEADVHWDPRAALGVVIAAGGYPEAYEKGNPISGLSSTDESVAKVFHAGTAEENGRVVTNGGRVLCVVGMGDSVTAAREIAYKIARRIEWEGAFFRSDIGYRAVRRELAPK